MASTPLPCTVDEVDSPCFLVDLDKVTNNAKSMIERCRALGIRLRPHMKTAKSREAGELATDGTKRCICVSTLAEAEFYADAGFEDIIYAMLISDTKIPRLRVLTGRLEAFHVLVDNTQHIKLLEDHPPVHGRHWSIYLAVNTGSNREGVLWDSPDIWILVEQISQANQLQFRGLYTHEGVASYQARGSQVKEVSNTTAERITHAANQLKESGLRCHEVSMGATPTASLPGDKVKAITEIHPGNYIFYDTQQQNIGSCEESDIACRVLTRVIGQYPDRQELLVDAGWSAVSLDGKLPNGSYGAFQGHPHLRLTKMHQEYGFVSYDPEHHRAQDFPIGTRLYLYPYHSCATAMLHKQYHIHRGEMVIAVWNPCNQW